MAALAGPFLFEAYYQQINPPPVRAIWWSFIESNNIFTHLPMVTEGSLIKKGKRVIDQLPTVDWMPVGQEPTTTFWQSLIDYEEGLALSRKNFQIDRLLLNDKNYVNSDPTQLNVKAYMKARAFALDNYFYNNSKVQGPIEDGNGFIGIKYRLADTTGPSGTSIFGCNPACNVQSTADLSTANLSGSGAIKLTKDWDKVLDHMGVPDGKGVLSTCSPQLLRQIDAIIKTAGTAGGFKITEDAFGRTVRSYRGMEIQSCGYLPPLPGGLQIAPVIDDAQDVNGWSAGDNLYNATGAVYTTQYFMRRGEEYFHAWQHSDPWMVKERVPGTRQHYILFDMTAGIYQPDTRAIARLYGIKTDGPTGD